MRNGCISEGKADLIGEARERRQNFTTWGILALAVFVSVGMAEWSKRTAAGETVIDPAVMEEAVKIAAAAAAVNVKVDVNENLGGGSRVAGGGLPNLESGKNLSDLGVSAVKSLSTAEAQSLLRRGYAGQGRGGVLHSGGNEAGKIETSAGANQ